MSSAVVRQRRSVKVPVMAQVAKLCSVRILHYRSCEFTEFYPHNRLSALIGMNGAGKTNILSALRILGRPVDRVLNKKSLENIEPCVLEAGFSVGEKIIKLSIIFYLSDSDKGQDEIVHAEELWDFSSISDVKEWVKFPKMSSTQDGEVRFIFEDELILNNSSKKKFGESFNFAFELVKNKEIVSAVSAIFDFRKSIKYYGATQFTDPSRCPGNFEVDEEGRLIDTQLSKTSAHAKFLHDLYSLKKSDVEKYEAYCRFVARDNLGLVSRITWREIELSSYTAEVKGNGPVARVRKKKTLVIPRVQIGSKYISFNQLSEGTFKALALVFNVMNDSATCLLVEEPEVCVHHGLLNGLFSTIEAFSLHKQIILSTHSDLLVDKLNVENTFVVQMTPSGTVCYDLNSWLGPRGIEALHTYLEEDGGLGDFWRAGGFVNGH